MDNKIKVVIDIDKTLFENAVEQTKTGYVGSDVWIAVANGKPCGTCIETIENSHAFVARPQGEWKIREAKDNDGDLIGHELYCSNCGKVKVRFISRCYTVEEVKEQLKDQFANFCSECGADMRGDNKETTFDDYLKEQLKDPEFRKEWEKLGDEDMQKGNAE